MRKWCSHADKDSDWNVIYQIVVPFSHRQHVLCLAHDHQLAVHLGITKTYNRILSHFFWPGLKKKMLFTTVVLVIPVRSLESQIRAFHLLLYLRLENRSNM